MPALHLQIHVILSIHSTRQLSPHSSTFIPYTAIGMEMSVGFQLQADLIMGISKEEEQNKENIPPLLAGSSGSPFISLHLLKRRPLQDITHLIATSTNMNTIHDRRRTLSVMETSLLVESMAHGRNKKRKIANLSSVGKANLVNPKRPMLRRSFR